MKKLIQITLLSALASGFAHAQPSSDVAWTPKQLNFVKKGNSSNGQKLSASCAGCHGEQGVSMTPENPSLAGQLATYLYKQLQDYKKGQREHAVMTSMASGLSEQDMADIAAWYSGLPLPKNKADPSNAKAAELLVSRGDGKRTLPPCAVCHGSAGKGEKMDIPALAGQQSTYLTATLLAYKEGARHNDVYSRMRLIAQQLSPEEIKAVANYYQQLQ